MSSDPDVACEAGLSLVRRAEEPGPMGPAPEAVEAVFDSAVQLASLVVAVALVMTLVWLYLELLRLLSYVTWW
ncbi:Bax inhibitor-1/YccA family membrane protein [Streptomyces lydicus]|uniref:Bax inhibitor-1/YccA family membrane protein n=1 Tax=Streptomyces lydicus TaxID=47763 RepID=UPI00379D8E9E